MNIKLYTDCDCRMLSDVYSPNAEFVPQYELIDYENLLLKNAAKAKVSARKQIGGDKAKLLQICHVYGDVDIDDVAVGKMVRRSQALSSAACSILQQGMIR